MSRRIFQLLPPAIFLVPSVSYCQNPPLKACGTPVDGLQLCLAKSLRQDKVLITLRNVGNADSALNLGVMGGNGKKDYPTALSLVCHDETGTKFRLELVMGGIAPSRIDPLVVPLPAGSSFTVTIPLTELGIPGFDRRTAVTARFEGQQLNSRTTNRDMAGVAFMPFWAGTVDSNPVTFSAPKKP